MKKFSLILICLLLLFAAGCSVQDAAETADTPAVSNDIAAAALLAEASGEFTADIRLSGDSASVSGSGAALDDGILTVSAPGCYRLAGELDGSIVIDCDGAVELMLCGLRIRGEGYALFAKHCDSLTLTLTADNGQSYFSQTLSAEDNGVCLSAKAPLTVQGSGSLTLYAEGVGLHGSKGVTLAGGSLSVVSGDNGIKTGDDGAITVSGGSLSVETEGKALKAPLVNLVGGSVSLNSGEAAIDADTFNLTGGDLTIDSRADGIHAEALLSVGGGSLNLSADFDGLQATSALSISGGDVYVETAGGGGSAYYVYDAGGMGFGGPSSSASASYTLPDYSCKALKSNGTVTISGGTVNLNSCDDAIHAAGDVLIENGDITICSNDDAIHSDANLTVNDGRILITDCFEGLEACIITVNGGDADIYAVNDGINASSSDGDGFGFGFGGSSAAFNMNGGSVEIFITGSSSNLGDGIDSNGSITINGGYLTSSTDGSSMENGIDSGSSFVVNGGIVASGGNSGMQESASADSLQCTAVLSASVQAGTECVVTDAEGSELIRFTPYRSASCLVFSHPDFAIGETYTVTYGTQSQDFTFSSVSYSAMGGFGFGGGPGGGGGGGRPF